MKLAHNRDAESPEEGLWSHLSGLASRFPGEPAILAPERSALTFAALLERVSETREALNRFGIGRGDRVAIALPNGPELAVCLLGTMACAIAAPLSPSATKEELQGHLRRIRPKALIVSRRAADTPGIAAAEQLAIAPIFLTPDAADPGGSYALHGQPGTCTDRRWNTGDDIGTILLTSGTTSSHKVAPIRSRHQLAYALGINALLSLGPGDRSLLIMPLFHASGLNSSFLVPLLNGAAVACLGQFEVSSFFRFMDAFRPTWLTGGYALLKAILDDVEAHREVVQRSRIRFIRSGTGHLNTEVKEGLEKAFRAPVIEQYSSTETGVIACCLMPPEATKAGSVGRPIVNEVAILGPAGRFCARGEEGEILVRGPSVFDGYLDDPEANEAAFIDRWYRTGDLGYLDADGFLTITGRVKQLINRGGEKIAPVEIEKTLSAHEAVRDVKVFGIPHPTLGEELVAAVVLRNGKSATESELRAYAAARLSPFKVPRRFLIRDAFPLTASMKLDVRTLVAECQESLDRERSDRSMRNAGTHTEDRMRRLWSEVLKKQQVDLDEDFFLLGGDSLKAVELLVLVEREFGVALPSQSMYADATVSGLASRIDQLLEGTGPEEDPIAVPRIAKSAGTRRRTIVNVSDMVNLLTFLTLSPLAWLLPRKGWPWMCDAIARAHIRLKHQPTVNLDKALGMLDVRASTAEIYRSLLSQVYEDLLMTLREHLFSERQPDIRLDGLDNIISAQAAGRGAILWSCPSPFGGLVSKKAFKTAGIDIVNLRSSIHPYSGTIVGMRLLNPVRTRVENRYVGTTVTLDEADPVRALKALRLNLEANRVIAISANGSQGNPFHLPFLGGTLRLSLGAPTLAALHDAPLMPVFTARAGAGGFIVSVGSPIEPTSRRETAETARCLAQSYAKLLEAYVQRHPAEWRGWFMRNTWTANGQ